MTSTPPTSSAAGITDTSPEATTAPTTTAITMRPRYQRPTKGAYPVAMARNLRGAWCACRSKTEGGAPAGRRALKWQGRRASGGAVSASLIGPACG